MKEIKKNSKNVTQKLSLAKETIRQLGKDELTQAAGGANNPTGICPTIGNC